MTKIGFGADPAPRLGRAMLCAGVSALLLGAGAAHAASWSFGDVVGPGENKTYTINVSGLTLDATAPYVDVWGHGWVANYLASPDGDPGIDIIFDDDLELTCNGLPASCTGSDVAAAGPVYHAINLVGSDLIINIDNQATGFNTCSEKDWRFCAAYLSPLNLTVRLDFEGAHDPTYRVQLGGVPEPATWAMMIAGFGMAGLRLRRRRTLTA